MNRIIVIICIYASIVFSSTCTKVIVDIDGDTAEYYGPLVNGFAHGVGTAKYYNGHIYKGSFKNDQLNGYGECTWKNGTKYNGEWKNGRQHGNGSINYADGAKYIGEWINGKYHGAGTIFNADGDHFSGGFKNGSIDGSGTYTWKEGHTYTGEFLNNSRHGYGTMIWNDGSKYTGEWRNNEQLTNTTKSQNRNWNHKSNDREMVRKWSYKFYNSSVAKWDLTATYVSNEMLQYWKDEHSWNSSINKSISNLQRKIDQENLYIYVVRIGTSYTNLNDTIDLKDITSTFKLYNLNNRGEEYYPSYHLGSTKGKLVGGQTYYAVVAFKVKDLYQMSYNTLEVDCVFHSQSFLKDRWDENTRHWYHTKYKTPYSVQFSFQPNGVPFQKRPKDSSFNFDTLVSVIQLALDISKFFI